MRNKDIKENLQTRIGSGTAKSANLQVILDNLTTRPRIEATPEQVEFLAQSGVSVKNICGLFQKSFNFLSDNPELQAAYERGRATVGSRIRARLVDAALEENSMQAAIYLDRVMGGDQVAAEVNVNVTNQPLQEIDTNQLLDIVFTEVPKNED